jgi:hypothetical protein
VLPDTIIVLPSTTTVLSHRMDVGATKPKLPGTGTILTVLPDIIAIRSHRMDVSH